jgi:hypothetical protein
MTTLVAYYTFTSYLMLVTVSPWKQMIVLDPWMFPIFEAGLAANVCNILDNAVAHLRAPASS